MKLDVEPNKYVVAVSGGVDSVVCLDCLTKINGLDLVVAHFDHGIRPNSEADRLFVEELAKKYQLKFEYKRENLGAEASEATARQRRYKFLNEIKDKYQAAKIITAHHQDDLLETAAINVLRGTHSKGLIAIYNPEYLRPLLSYTKQQILDYARQNNLVYQEDSTNVSDKYLRNRVRKKLADVSPDNREILISLINNIKQNHSDSQLILSEVWEYCQPEDNTLNRIRFISLPHRVACELMVFWLRKNSINFDRKLIEKLTINVKSAKNNSFFDIDKHFRFLVSQDKIRLVTDKDV